LAEVTFRFLNSFFAVREFSKIYPVFGVWHISATLFMDLMVAIGLSLGVYVVLFLHIKLFE
jgi:hypothetical protein